MAYTHSKDYLIELANNSQTQGWLKDLIIKIVNSNGNISDAELTASVAQLKLNAASELTIPSINVNNVHSDIRFISLIHHTGVCALSEEQRIDFSNDITLLYGKNGSGKSSYFRILNELIGGNHQTEIRSNIYSDTHKPINIELVYSDGANIKNLSWDGNSRAISPLNLSSVFDSSYTTTFLQKRSADSAIVLPYGLHLFTALTSAMDNIKSRIQTEIDGILRTLPQINKDGLSEDVVRILTQQTYRTTQKNYIQARYIFTNEQSEKLKSQEEKLIVLKETNFEDKIQLASNEQQQFLLILKHLKETENNLQKLHIESQSLIEKISTVRKDSEVAKQKISVLNDIGNTNSKEWKTFIEAGAAFAKNSTLNENVCPYCRQPIVDNAVNIVTAYATYLSDKSIEELKKLEQTKNALKQRISTIITNFTISTQFKSLIDARSSESELYSKISVSLCQLDEQKRILSYAVENEQNINPLVFDSTNDTISAIEAICEEYNNTIKKTSRRINKEESDHLRIILTNETYN